MLSFGSLVDKLNRRPSLAADINSAKWLRDKIIRSNSYSQNLYAALCNNQFQKLDLFSILKDETWQCSWRAAGRIVSDVCGEGDYLDYYCSGMGGIAGYDTDDNYLARNSFVTEGTVTDEVAKDLRRLGWLVVNPKG